MYLFDRLTPFSVVCDAQIDLVRHDTFRHGDEKHVLVGEFKIGHLFAGLEDGVRLLCDAIYDNVIDLLAVWE